MSSYATSDASASLCDIWVNPNGGDLADKMFRVGHIGDLTIEDNDKLIEAFNDLKGRGII